MSGADTNPPFALGPTYGAFYMSAILCTGLWSITCVQLFMYIVNYPKDHKYLKALVFCVWIFDTVHMLLIVKGVYTYLVTRFGDYAGFTVPVLETVWEFLFNLVVSIPTQGFFVWRLWKFTNGNWIPVILWIPTALLQTVVVLIWVARGIHVPDTLAFSDPFFKALSITYLTTVAVVDLILSAGMTYMLAQKQPKSGFDRTRKGVRLLVVFSVNSGLWTAIFAILSIALFLAFPTNVLYTVFDFPIGSVYSNTLLANLNARKVIREGMANVTTGTSNSIQFSVPRSTLSTGDMPGRKLKGSVHAQYEDQESHEMM